MDIKEIQRESFKIIEEYNNKHGLRHNKDTVFYHLVEEVGELAREIYHEKNDWRAKFDKDKLASELADVLAQTLNIATDYNIDIEEAFKKKVASLRKRFKLGD